MAAHQNICFGAQRRASCARLRVGGERIDRRAELHLQRVSIIRLAIRQAPNARLAVGAGAEHMQHAHLPLQRFGGLGRGARGGGLDQRQRGVDDEIRRNHAARGVGLECQRLAINRFSARGRAAIGPVAVRDGVRRRPVAELIERRVRRRAGRDGFIEDAPLRAQAACVEGGKCLPARDRRRLQIKQRAKRGVGLCCV